MALNSINSIDSEIMENEKVQLKHAVDIAVQGIGNGSGPFGAVITLEGEIIAEACNRVVLNNDPTAHAEVLAIRAAAAHLKSHDLSKCTLYTSCEPCPMCLGAIYWAGIKKVIYSCDRADAESAGFSDKLIYDEISLDPGKRKITFLHITDAGGQEIFKIWDKLDNKVPY
jgi:guanine deaminase